MRFRRVKDVLLDSRAREFVESFAARGKTTHYQLILASQTDFNSVTLNSTEMCFGINALCSIRVQMFAIINAMWYFVMRDILTIGFLVDRYNDARVDVEFNEQLYAASAGMS